jgi:hypothetical protein
MVIHVQEEYVRIWVIFVDTPICRDLLFNSSLFAEPSVHYHGIEFCSLSTRTKSIKSWVRMRLRLPAPQVRSHLVSMGWELVYILGWP